MKSTSDDVQEPPINSLMEKRAKVSWMTFKKMLPMPTMLVAEFMAKQPQRAAVVSADCWVIYWVARQAAAPRQPRITARMDGDVNALDDILQKVGKGVRRESVF